MEIIRTKAEILVDAQTTKTGIMYFDSQYIALDESIVNEIAADGTRDMGRVSFWVLCSTKDPLVKDTFNVVLRVPLDIRLSEFKAAMGSMTFDKYLAGKHGPLLDLIAKRPQLFFGVTGENLEIVNVD